MNARRAPSVAPAVSTYIIVLVAALLLGYPPRPAAADSPLASSNVTISGKVVGVDGDRDLVTVETDDGATYTVDTLGTTIVLKSGKSGTTDDLAPEMRVQVKGSLLSSDLMTANELDVLPDRPAPAMPPPAVPAPAPVSPPSASPAAAPPAATPPPAPGVPAAIPPVTAVTPPANDAGKDVPLPISLRGTVVDVNNDQETFDVHINDHQRTIYVSDRTAFPNLPAPNGALPLHPGDRVSVDGKLLTDGTVNAAVVRMVRPVHSLHELVGSVASPSTSVYRRSIELRLDGGPLVRVRMPRGIDIEDAGVSVRELAANDVVRIEGEFRGNDFSATRIDVLQPAANAQ